MTLTPLLLNFITLFQRKAKYLQDTRQFYDRMQKQNGVANYQAFNWYNTLHDWFMSMEEETEAVGLQRNEATFDWLYWRTMLNEIPEAWLTTQYKDLGKFTVII